MPGRVLSFADQVCLAVVSERPTHGWAIVRLLRPDGELGRIWSLSRPLTYRSIDLVADEQLLVRNPDGRRTLLRATRLGRRRSAEWLIEPVDHLRELRTEFLMKLELCRRADIDVTVLIERQRNRLHPAITTLTAGHPSDPVELWRQESALAAERFLDRIGEHVQSSS